MLVIGLRLGLGIGLGLAPVDMWRGEAVAVREVHLLQAHLVRVTVRVKVRSPCEVNLLQADLRRGDAREMRGRCERDAREMRGRCEGEPRALRGRCKGDAREMRGRCEVAVRGEDGQGLG